MSFDNPMSASAATPMAKSYIEGPQSSEKSRTTKETKCELVEFNDLPEYLKDNEFILSYYRSEWPMKETILSIFSVHNETLNVWTHLIGFLLFLALTVVTAMMISRDLSSFSIQKSLNSVDGIHSKDMNYVDPSSSTATDELLTPLPTSDMLPPLSSWNLKDVLLSCLPKKFSRVENFTSSCVLTSMKEDVSNMISPLLVKPITRWPFFAFLIGAMFCLLTSSICHLISCHSEKMAYFMLRLDYTGIASLIVTSFFPLVYYTFMCDPFYCNLYIGFITTFGVAAVLASLVPVFQTPEFRCVRATLFCCMGVSGVVPIVHKILIFGDRQEVLASVWYEVLMGVFYGLGVIVYAARVPERWLPGKFDIVGHSHQLFHVLVIAGAYTHYFAGLEYLRWRDVEKC